MAPKITSPHGGASVPLPGQVISVVLSLAATTVLTLFLTQRVLVIKAWKRLPLVVWLVFAIYVDSYTFVVATAVLQHSLGINSSYGLCEAAIILCLVCYVTTKILIYLFLAEKAYIIRGATRPRLRSKLYLVNSLGMLTIYIAVVILNFAFRIARMEKGECIIGMQSVAMIPLISFDTIVNVYLTILFLVPLKNLYSYTNMARTRANARLRMVAFRTFCGAVCTLVSSIVNLSVLMALDGEPGWLCLMLCNCDILFSAIVVQWVTSKDNAGTVSNTSSREGRRSRDLGSVMHRTSTPSELREIPPSTLADISLVPTRRRSRGAEYDDPHDPDTPDGTAAKPTNPASSVTVTTTIEHEIKPRCYDLVEMVMETSKTCGYECVRRLGSDAVDERFLASQTKVTAGRSRLSEDLDQKAGPCCCRITRFKLDV